MDNTAVAQERLARAMKAIGGLPEEWAAAVLSGVEVLVGSGPEKKSEMSAVELEKWASAVGRRIARPLLEAQLQARLDEADEREQAACEKCGRARESQGRRERQWISQLGPLKLRRRYLHCASCQEGEAPAQREVGLTDTAFTPELESVCTQMSATVPYAQAVAILGSLLGVDVSVKAAESAVERRASWLFAQQLEEAGRCAAYDEKGLPVAQQQRPADAQSAGRGVCYVEIDGVVPMTREEIPRCELTAAQKRKQARAKKAKARGGRGRKYHLVGREVKNAVLYRAEDCARESPSRGCLLGKRYVSHLGDPQTFAKLLWVEMLRLGFDQTRTLVWLSDGAEWIRKLAEHLPVKPLLILDLFHVKHRIWEVARLLYGEHSPQTNRWARAQCDRIEANHAPAVIHTLRFLKPRGLPAREAVTALTGYLDANLDRMDYPAYLAQGLRVGSGAVESANYHVTGSRLKLQGMRWTKQGAAHMALLRADLCNDRWSQTTLALQAA